MTATAKIDRVTTLEASERHGVFSRLVRQARVVGLSDTDYTQLMSALEASGIPAAGSSLTGFPNLILTERNPRLVDLTTCDVDLVYESGGGEGQDFADPPFGVLVGSMDANIQQTTTNLDANGTPITVSHTFPEDDPDYPDETKVQGGEIQVFQPQATLRFEGKKTTAAPWLIADGALNKVNVSAWAGRAPRTWMCSRTSWRLIGVDSNRLPIYSMSFEFQYNPDTWDPYVVYIDERTGKPPTGLVEGTGYKYIAYHTAVNFEAVIGANLVGF